MKKTTFSAKNERGQALILIVFAIIGLLGMTGLTVDGGLAYSDRRHAQNAADTAAIAAARAKIRGEPWKGAGLFMARENGYVDLDSSVGSTDDFVNVEVYGCDEIPATCEGIPVGRESEYIQVRITSVVRTMFARIVGVSQITNRVNSIAQAKPGTVDPSMFGNAMVSLMCGCKGQHNWPHDPFTVTGNVVNVVGGAGIFVNSGCPNAYTQGGSSKMDSEYGVCVVGGASYNAGTFPAPDTGCGEPYSCPPPIVWPKPSCDFNGNGVMDPDEMGDVIEVSGGPNPVYRASPGYFTNFPKKGQPGKLIMQKGVYCLDGNVSLNGGWNLTTDVNNSGTHDEYTEGVLIMVMNGKFDMLGSSDLNLYALSDPNVPEDLRNLLFYLPPENSNTLSINGNNGSTITGSIWAPSSHCSVSGSSGSVGVNSQVMCFTVSTSGGAQLNITYNSNVNHIIKVPPSIELNK
jgi:hypothetical protein